MKYQYTPKTKLEKFGQTVYQALVENSHDTFYVGGMVRDLLLQKKITDIDLATALTPNTVAKILRKHHIQTDTTHANFGVVHARQAALDIEIATFRTESYQGSRFPRVTFITSAKQDSERRDFTINALYLSQKDQIIKDFQRGLFDIKTPLIRFIGTPARRLTEDPLRLVRALRFQLVLGAKLAPDLKRAINNYFSQLKTINHARLELEIKKIPSRALQQKLKKILVVQKIS